MRSTDARGFPSLRETGRGMLVVGADPSEVPQLRRAAIESGLALVAKPSVPAAAAWMERESPGAVLIDLRTLLACDLISSLRRTPRWEHVPILGLSERVSETAFAETFWAGGDDVVSPADVDAIVARLRNVHGQRKPEREDERGRVVVAGGEASFRIAATRVLSGAGYEVDAAVTSDEVDEAAADPQVRAIVLSASLPGTTAFTVIEAARAAGRRVPFVVSAPPRQMAKVRALARRFADVTACDAFAAPDEILFATNEVLSPARDDRRTSPRVAYGSLVWLRPAGAEKDLVGLTYNVSERGLFVRTLHPFAAKEDVWIEMVPPRGDRRVRLVGQAAWRRPFGPSGPALCPPGTGFQITGGLPGDLELFESGVQKLMADSCAS
ncbi:MAG: PilZ domain-containing protein [Polyangiaceae bacterium]